MRILFIRQPTTFTYPMIAAGMGTVATLVHRAGHDVRVIDNNSMYRHYGDRALMRLVDRYEPHVIAFSITIVNAKATYDLVGKMKRRHPEMLFLAGGMHMKAGFAEALEFGFDIVVNRDAEVVIVPLMDALEGETRDTYRQNLAKVPGVSFLKEDGSLHIAGEFPVAPVLDDIPFVDYSLVNLQDFFKHKKEPAVILINGQRGCPYRCTFCSDQDLRRDRRSASAETMFNSIRHIHETYGVSYIWIADNNFFVPRSRAVEFCERMIASGLNARLSLVAQTKIETALDDDLLALAKEAGIKKLGFGLERLEERSQVLIRKKTSIEDTHRILALVRSHGISISLNLILAFPFDTVEIVETERALFRDLLKYTQNVVVNPLTPVPGTMYYDDYPKAERWYLDPRALRISKSYYGHVLDLALVDVLDINYFDLPRDVLAAVRKTYREFKLFNYGAHVVRQSRLFRLGRKLDLWIAGISRGVFRISPRLEFMIFKRIKALRYYLATRLFSDKVTN